MVRQIDLLVSLITLGTLLLVALPCRADEITGVVQDAEGLPVAGVEVRLDIGRAHYALTQEFDRWYAVETKTGKTGDDGRFTFSDLPEGSVGTAFVKTDEAIGIALGSGELTVTLGPPGVVRGSLLGKRRDIKGLSVYVRGGRGLGGASGTVEKRGSKYEVGGLAPGEGCVFIKRGNFDVAWINVKIEAGKTAAVKRLKIKEKGPVGADPLVQCTKAKLVDSKGKPVAGVQLIWSSQWMDGGMNSDEEGIVRLAGGGVAIGGPPYLLRLSRLAAKEAVFCGVLEKTRKGVAVVQLNPLREVAGTVKRGEDVLESYRLLVVGPGDVPRVYVARVESGRFSVHLPLGKCRFIVGTVDGKRHVHEFDIAEESSELDVVLK